MLLCGYMKYPQLQSIEWIREQIQTRSLRDIAKEVGSSYGAIIHTVRKFQLEVPWKKSGPKSGTNMKIVATNAYRKKYPNGRFGQEASNWRGGRRYGGTKMSYVLIYSPDHPYAVNGGYVMEHRLVMEKHLGRYLLPQEVVHHKNGVKDDNRLENLEYMASRKAHAREHFDAVKVVEQLKKIIQSCKVCQKKMALVRV